MGVQKAESSNSSSVLLWSREITRNITDEEPRTTTSTFTQLLSSECVCSSSVLLDVHRDHKTGTGAQDGHLDFHTAPELRAEG